MQGPCWTLSEATIGTGRVFPQHQEMGRGYDYDAPDSVHRVPLDSLPAFEPNFNTVVVHGHARLTDLLSSGVIVVAGYLVSPRLREVLEGSRLPLHRFYPVPMTHRGKSVSGYSWLHLPAAAVDIRHDATPAEAEAAIRAVPGLAECDLLRLNEPDRFAYCFVSDPLRRAIEAAGITGVRFGTARLFRNPTGVTP